MRAHATAVLAVAAVTLALRLAGPLVNQATVALGLLLPVLFVATRAGVGPAVTAALAGVVCFNFFFIPPIGTLTIADPLNWIALGVFLTVAAVAGSAFGRARDRAFEAERLYRELAAAGQEATRAAALRESDTLKTALLDAVTHELRTPLTGIKAAATALGGDTAGRLDAGTRGELLSVVLEEVAAGTAALASAIPALVPFEIPIAVSFVLLIAVMNLRGVKESGKIFAVPTYYFLVNMALLLGVGIVRFAAGNLPEDSPHPGQLGFGHSGSGLLMGASAFVVLRAFASGGAAVTGVEAISDGVPAFKEPAWKNARTTLVIMGATLAVMFIGLSSLAAHMHVGVYERGTPTVISQIGKLVFGETPIGHLLYLSLQAGTLLILVLAANTSFADFPRLANFAAADHFMPRQLTNRGHRLVFSNGIISLAAASIVVVLATEAQGRPADPALRGRRVHELHALADGHGPVPREAQGAGLEARTLHQRVRCVPVVRRRDDRRDHEVHARRVGDHRARPDPRRRCCSGSTSSTPPRPTSSSKTRRAPRRRRSCAGTSVLVFIDTIDLASARALQYARTLAPDEMRAVHFAVDMTRAKALREQWLELGFSRITLEIVACPDRRIQRAGVEMVAEVLADGKTEVSVLLPRIQRQRIWHKLLHDRTADALAEEISDLEHANVTFVPYHLGRRHTRDIAARYGRAGNRRPRFPSIAATSASLRSPKPVIASRSPSPARCTRSASNRAAGSRPWSAGSATRAARSASCSSVAVTSRGSSPTPWSR